MLCFCKKLRGNHLISIGVRAGGTVAPPPTTLERKHYKITGMLLAWFPQRVKNVYTFFMNLRVIIHPTWGRLPLQKAFLLSSLVASRDGAGMAQGWRSGESARLLPLWPGFDSRTRRHKWVEFVVSSRACSEGFFLGSPVFLLPLKSTLLNSNSTWKQWMKSYFVEMPLQSHGLPRKLENL